MQRKLRIKVDVFDLTDSGFMTKDMAFVQENGKKCGTTLCPWTGEVIWRPQWHDYWPWNEPSPFIEHYDRMITRGHKMKPLNKYSNLD